MNVVKISQVKSIGKHDFHNVVHVLLLLNLHEEAKLTNCCTNEFCELHSQGALICCSSAVL